MKKDYPTQEQIKEIRKLGAEVFNGDIEEEAYLVFSPWLSQQFGIYTLRHVTGTMAPLIVEKLTEMKNITVAKRHG